MTSFNHLLRAIPPWAFALVLLAMTVNTLYFIYKHKIAVDGMASIEVNGKSVITYVTPGGASERAGMLPGDTLLTVDGEEVHAWSDICHGEEAGDTCIYGVVRNGRALDLPVVFTSPIKFFYGITVTIFVILLLVSASSLFLIYKKPNDQAIRLFFIYLQVFAISQNATYLNIRDPVAMAATIIFFLSGCLMGPLLVNFHLLFPRPARIYNRLEKFPLLYYLAGMIFFILILISYLQLMEGQLYISTFNIYKGMMLSWLTFSYFLAVAIVIYQFMTIKDTLSRNQLRLVLIGSFFGIYTAVALVFFPGTIAHLSAGHPFLFSIAQGIGGLIMIACILTALFRYRIWDIEVIIRKALQYVVATAVIVLSYLMLLYLVDLLTIRETKAARFVILALSVIIFLVLRDRIQRMTDRMFHRETYDSATVVADFEQSLSGIFQGNELISGIVKGLDEIFHFRSFIFNLKKEKLTYGSAFILGPDHDKTNGEFEIDSELENRLGASKVFSPGELDLQSFDLAAIRGELIVPLIKDDRPYGFFTCGPKQSEKTYSIQDIRVLSLIARRVTALFHTATLYQKDLDRQLMLERERARISQDMHDDVGASLTRISMMSDLVRNMPGTREEAGQWLGQISDTSRGVMEEMNQIIWALNPMNDTLEGLITYIRRFINDYLEPTTINWSFDLPESLPVRALTVEVRRNVYLVVREAIHNVVKHAGATKININLEVNDHGFRIRIQDNGKGFDPAKLEFPGNGLVNMKKRMNEIGGELVIQSILGERTEVELVVR